MAGARAPQLNDNILMFMLIVFFVKVSSNILTLGIGFALGWLLHSTAPQKVENAGASILTLTGSVVVRSCKKFWQTVVPNAQDLVENTAAAFVAEDSSAQDREPETARRAAETAMKTE